MRSSMSSRSSAIAVHSQSGRWADRITARPRDVATISASKRVHALRRARRGTRKPEARNPMPMHEARDETLAYQQLRPDDILSAVESLELACDGRLLTLNSYE